MNGERRSIVRFTAQLAVGSSVTEVQGSGEKPPEPLGRGRGGFIGHARRALVQAALRLGRSHRGERLLVRAGSRRAPGLPRPAPRTRRRRQPGLSDAAPGLPHLVTDTRIRPAEPSAVTSPATSTPTPRGKLRPVTAAAFPCGPRSRPRSRSWREPARALHRPSGPARQPAARPAFRICRTGWRASSCS